MLNGFYGTFRTESRIKWNYKKFFRFWKNWCTYFFLISGFLAAKTFVGKKSVEIKKYYLKRAIAILPLYYLIILFYFISENILNVFVEVIPQDELGIGWLRYIFLLNGFFYSDTYFWSNLGITWTIPIFMFFYLIAPWILRNVKGVLSATLTWLMVLVVSKVIGAFYSCSILTNLHFLFFGVIIYCCSHKKKYKLSIVVMQVAAIGSHILGLENFFYMFIFSSIILILISMEDYILPDKIMSVVNVLDKYSYTLYLMHGVVFCSVLDRLNTFKISKVLIAIIAILGTFLSTWIVGKYIEKPLQRFLCKKILNS